MSPFILGCFDLIILILAGNKDLHKILDNWNFGQIRVSCHSESKNRCFNFFFVDIDLIIFKLAGNTDITFDEVEFWSDRTTDHAVSCPLVS